VLSVSDGPCSIMILDLSPSGEIIVTVSNTAGREEMKIHWILIETAYVIKSMFSKGHQLMVKTAKHAEPEWLAHMRRYWVVLIQQLSST
jgi:hypothetical protein